MVNIYDELDFDENVSIEDWNKLITDVFFDFFDDRKHFINSKELLRTEIVNYIKYIKNKKENEALFYSIYNEFKKAIDADKSSSINEIAKDFLKIANVDTIYMNYYVSQSQLKLDTDRDIAIYYFDMIDKVLESCFKPKITLFYKFYIFNKKNIFPEVENKKFGNIIDELKEFEDSLKDPILNIPIHQWRNISAHKDYKISKDLIFVEYGTKVKQKKELNHVQLKNITIKINELYCILRLAIVLINMNYIKEIKATNLIDDNELETRAESSLLRIFHNLQTVGFKFNSFKEIDDLFELNLYINQNSTLKESTIHASQAFTQIALALEDDEFQKNRFKYIKINILNEKSEILAYAEIDINSCLDYSIKKIDLNQLIQKINFKFL